MSAFADALGGLAQDYGQAGILKQRSDLASNEMQLRTAHEALYNAIAKKQLQQADFSAQQEKIKAGMPLFLGQPYSVGGKRFQDTWDIKGGKPGKLELGPEESPTDAFLREYQQANGVPAPPDIRNAALLHQFGITPPKTDKPTKEYQLVQNAGGRYVYMPVDPDNGPPRPSTIIGNLAQAQQQSGSPTLDTTDTAYGDRLAKGDLNLSQLAQIYKGKAGEAKIKGITNYAFSKGYNANEQLAPAAQTTISSTVPILNQANKMISDIENLGLQKNNTPFYLAPARAKYALGMASPEATLGQDIAGLSLGSVVEAASALKGSSRAIQALQIAMQHTPNPWTDSPMQLHQKLTTIKERLQDIVDLAKQYGTKSGLPNDQGTNITVTLANGDSMIVSKNGNIKMVKK